MHTPLAYRLATRKLSVRRTAAFVGVSPSLVHAWRVGRKPIAPKHRLALARLIGCREDEF